MSHNHYQVLGVGQTASAQEIKTAYKRLAIKYHPDKNPGNQFSEEMFKQVNAAYQVLSDPRKRALYDLRLQYQREQQHRAVMQHQPRRYEPRHYTTREPAGVHERHYKKRQPKSSGFSRKDWYITVAFVSGLILFSLLLKTVMDHIAGEDKYKTALTYIADGKYTSAHRLLTDAIHFIPDKAAAYEARAMIELDVYENYNSALQDLNKTISLQEQPSAQVYYMRGRSLQQLEQYRQAEEDLTKALELNDRLWHAHLKRGEIRLFYLHKYDDAIADLNTFLRNSSTGPEQVEALTFRGFAYYKQGQWEQSAQDYQAGLVVDKANGRLHYLLGRTQMEQQLPDSACVRFSKAYELGYSAALLELRARCQP
ncbi:tetratricopeptide repeat protein [Pontibacter chinhatensis]|uniref:Tetratricopeptide repeat-containing protein n=1 Tax=Pontibacter chinhatensis TaxID=1436961 RepID=A0A1I2TRS6_9BACT|nr:DnaJ domain-containing protein [Pontibacter chinhatensis]SFG65051.1 Tetratricopeptide repeat-containing protein [Pontibacter chinhatensis]